ncbi:unnamed protein product [marine sediment metagenome]|uniref:Uncharacterized protein n=1 Tax=marine sediment metagenome TaxID=412755 RepID=X1IQ38_9ZZZZ
MNHKLLYSSIGLLSAGVVGLIIAIVMEIQTDEPVYYLMMKVAAGFFGVGGPLLGLDIARRSSRKDKKKR